MSRHGRQIMLAGVGGEGQARIASATVILRGGGLAREVAARYLAGAGIAHLRVGDEAIADAAKAVDPTVRVDVDADCAGGTLRADVDLRDSFARAVGQGARAALGALNAILAQTPDALRDAGSSHEVEA